jgi:hypothetical protein
LNWIPDKLNQISNEFGFVSQKENVFFFLSVSPMCILCVGYITVHVLPFLECPEMDIVSVPRGERWLGGREVRQESFRLFYLND